MNVSESTEFYVGDIDILFNLHYAVQYTAIKLFQIELRVFRRNLHILFQRCDTGQQF